MAAIVYSSPIMRSLAVLPLFGYLILFNNEIQTFLENNQLSEKYDLDIPSTIKQIYYGGWMLLGSFLIFFNSAPGVIKQQRNLEDFEREFLLIGSAADVVGMVFQSARVPHLFGSNYGKLDAYQGHVKTFFGHLMDNLEHERDWRPEIQRVVEAIANSPEMGDDEYKSLEKFEGILYQSASLNAGHPLVMAHARIVANIFYVENDRTPIISRVICCLLATFGAVLVFYPAFSLFIQILFGDLYVQ